MATNISDFSSLLSSNEAPTTLEATSLQEEIARLTDLIQQYRSILSPLRRLPPEVLAEIFKIAVQDGWGLTDRQQLLDLCLVCKMWCNVAYSTPDLWGRLRITLDPQDQWIKEATRWLSMAKDSWKMIHIVSAPLLNCQCGAIGLESGCIVSGSTSLIKLLVEGPPLDLLSVDFDFSQCFINLQKALRDFNSDTNPPSWSLVKSLRIRFLTEGDRIGAWIDGDNQRPFMSDDYPCLTSLQLMMPCKVDLDDDMERPADIPSFVDAPINIHPSLLKRLTHLSVECDWGGPQIPLLLPHCTNVESLSITSTRHPGNIRNAEAHRIIVQGVVLPSVRKLKVKGVDIPSAGRVVSFLRVPSLTDLEVGLYNYGNHLDPAAANNGASAIRPVYHLLQSLSLFLGAPSSPSLRSLTISAIHYSFNFERCPTIDSQEVLDILTRLPSLTHIAFVDIPVRVLKRHRARTYGQPITPQPILPHLEQVTVEMGRKPDFPLGPFLRLLIKARRMRKPAKISSMGVVLEADRRDTLRRIVLRGYGMRPSLEAALRSSSAIEDLQYAYGVSVDLVSQ